MAKIAVVVLADSETHEALGRVVNALETAKEASEHNDELRIIFDGAGTRWIPELAKESHKAHPLYLAVKDKITGACDFCSAAFGVKQKVIETGVTLLNEYDRHPSLRKLVAEDFQVITF
jgi:hypothetical protein